MALVREPFDEVLGCNEIHEAYWMGGAISVQPDIGPPIEFYYNHGECLYMGPDAKKWLHNLTFEDKLNKLSTE